MWTCNKYRPQPRNVAAMTVVPGIGPMARYWAFYSVAQVGIYEIVFSFACKYYNDLKQMPTRRMSACILTAAVIISQRPVCRPSVVCFA
jgi:site-specific recombinase